MPGFFHHSNIYFLLSIFSSFLLSVQADFEDTRCRCTCPSTEYFSSKNITPSEHYRRYYTKTSLDSANCNAQTVVKKDVVDIVDGAHLDAFLANCNCRFESRNSLLLKVTVLFVIFVIFLLGSYMLYLGVIEPMVRWQQPFIPYRRHDGDQQDVGLNTFWFQDSDASVIASDVDDSDMEENIFASNPGVSASEESIEQNDLQMRARHSTGLPEKVISKVMAEQSKWKSDVEEQRRNVLNHNMLN